MFSPAHRSSTCKNGENPVKSRARGDSHPDALDHHSTSAFSPFSSSGVPKHVSLFNSSPLSLADEGIQDSEQLEHHSSVVTGSGLCGVGGTGKGDGEGLRFPLQPAHTASSSMADKLDWLDDLLLSADQSVPLFDPPPATVLTESSQEACCPPCSSHPNCSLCTSEKETLSSIPTFSSFQKESDQEDGSVGNLSEFVAAVGCQLGVPSSQGTVQVFPADLGARAPHSCPGASVPIHSPHSQSPPCEPSSLPLPDFVDDLVGSPVSREPSQAGVPGFFYGLEGIELHNHITSPPSLTRRNLSTVGSPQLPPQPQPTSQPLIIPAPCPIGDSVGRTQISLQQHPSASKSTHVGAGDQDVVGWPTIPTLIPFSQRPPPPPPPPPPRPIPFPSSDFHQFEISFNHNHIRCPTHHHPPSKPRSAAIHDGHTSSFAPSFAATHSSPSKEQVSPITGRKGTNWSRCFNCHEQGHLMSLCPQPVMLRCYDCHSPGHRAVNCTQEKRCRMCCDTTHIARHCPLNI
eukprot:GHVN01026013.1.p1 GENE.GHVN01026013.1~~GHVN01026013.1.p1  ORF type:complete len:516 (+),score=54.45 GHVN01026013.1:256-1803(+)